MATGIGVGALQGSGSAFLWFKRGSEADNADDTSILAGDWAERGSGLGETPLNMR